MNKIKTFFPFIVVGIGFLALFFFKLNDDFWNDEIYSLEFFTFVPLITTVTDYHVPNNHLFFNLVNNIYLKIIGVESLFDLMDTKYIIRVRPFVYSILVFVLVIRLGFKFFNAQVALLASIVLVTSIPFYNFGVQVRGYALSTLLLILIIYYGLSYLKQPSNKYWWLVVLFSCLCMYTLPSNLYPISGVLMGLGINTLFELKKDSWRSIGRFKKTLFESHQVRLIVGIFLGLGICLLFYSWIFTEVFDNKYVQSGAYFNGAKLKIYGMIIVHDLFSNRLLFFPLMLIGIIFNFKLLKKWWPNLLIFGFTCAMPLFWVFARGDAAPFRVFSVLVPVFSLLVAVGLYAVFVKVKRLRSYNLIYAILILGYSTYCFQFELKRLDQRIYKDIVHNRRSQDMYYQYYAFHFRPLSEMKAFKIMYEKNQLPVVVLGCEPEGIPFYLRKFQIPFYEEIELTNLLGQYDSIYVITNHPNKYFLDDKHRVTFLTPRLHYHNSLLVTSQ